MMMTSNNTETSDTAASIMTSTDKLLSELDKKIEKEKKNSRKNQLEIHDRWRKMMRLDNLENMKDEIHEISKTQEEDITRRDLKIGTLQRYVHESENHYQLAKRKHHQNVDRLIDLHDRRLITLEQDFENEIEALLQGIDTEREAILQNNNELSDKIKSDIKLVELKKRKKESVAKVEHEQQTEEIRTNSSEDINTLRTNLDAQMVEIEEIISQLQSKHSEEMEDITKEVHELASKDIILNKEIENKIEVADSLYGSLQKWRAKMIQHSLNCKKEKNSLLKQKKVF